MNYINNQKKYILIFVIIFTSILQKVISQTINNFADCSNYNRFLYLPNSINYLNYFADEIKSDGSIILNYNKVNELNDINSLFPYLDLNNDYTFIKTNEEISKLNAKFKYIKYQEYYKGVLVEGGGISERKSNGSITPEDPCGNVYGIYPHLVTNINIQVLPQVQKNSLQNILNNSLQTANNNGIEILTSELAISPNINNDCNLILTWKVIYNNIGTKTSWINANNGQLIKTIDNDIDLSAPTVNYGTKTLNDRTIGNTTTLESPDQRLRVFDFTQSSSFSVGSLIWDVNMIPSTTSNVWTNESNKSVYQSFYSTSMVIEKYDEIGVNFNDVFVANYNGNNAFALGTSTLQNTRICIGKYGENSFALHDVIGHELGHTYLNSFLNYNGATKSLHEGLSDIFGTYIESLIDGVVDWGIGDDNSYVNNLVDRNLSDYSCLTNVNSSEEHTRGKPIGHWFFLISQGNSSQYPNIPALGLLKSIYIIQDALLVTGREPDYEQFMNATLNIVLNEFGRCSNEFLSVSRAWEKICVQTGYIDSGDGIIHDCYYIISGNRVVCEESNSLQLCIQNGPSNGNYKWVINGESCTNFQSIIGMNGNQQIGGTCLDLIQFPTLPYYPQFYNLTITPISPSYLKPQTIRFCIFDCDGDDPTCEEYYGFNINSKNINSIERNSLKIDEEIKMIVIDYLGRVIYSGRIKNEGEIFNSTSNNLLIFQYFDINGKLLHVDKKINIKN